MSLHSDVSFVFWIQPRLYIRVPFSIELNECKVHASVHRFDRCHGVNVYVDLRSLPTTTTSGIDLVDAMAVCASMIKTLTKLGV